MPSSEEDEALRLTLSPPGRIVSTTTTNGNHEESQKQQQEHHHEIQSQIPQEQQQAQRQQSKSATGSSQASASSSSKEDRIAPPYPWATDRRAVVHSLDFLKGCGLQKVHGEVVCKRCDGSMVIEVGVESGFVGVNSYFMAHRDTMHDRAPKIWTAPRLLDCTMCLQTDCVKPVIHPKKRNINWLFLLLTQTLGLCTLDQLKYFCKHTRRHRTGAKDRVLYLTYVGLLKQLNPSGPY